jgi:phosphate:Na+ symporter
VNAKRRLNDFERNVTRDHLARLDGSSLEASNLFLAALRDLKLVNSHLASIGYAVLGDRGDQALSRPLFMGTDELRG